MGVLQYVGKSDRWFPAAVVELANNGSVTVRYDHVDSDEPPLLRTESRTGWVSNKFGFTGGITIPPMLLEPGSNIVFYVPLPDGTLRWQLRYTIRRASSHDQIRSKLTGEGGNRLWGDRLYRLVGNSLSTSEGPPQEFWSEVFEIPSGRKRANSNK